MMKPRQKALKDLIKFAKKSIMEEKLKHRKFMEKKYHIVTYGCRGYSGKAGLSGDEGDGGSGYYRIQHLLYP